MTPTMPNELSYSLGKEVDLGKVMAEINAFWKELEHDDALRKRVAARVDVDKALQNRSNLVAHSKGERLAPAAVIVIKVAAPLVGKILADVWSEFILPRIKAKYGKDAIKPK